MPTKAKYYAWAVIGAGAVILASRLGQGLPAASPIWAACLLLGIGAGLLRLRLPGLEGNYSPTFLPILFSATHFGMTETLLVGVVAALAQSYLNVPKRPPVFQAAFNVANLVISVGAMYSCFGALSAAGVASGSPAAVASAAVVYFVLNTCLVSGVLARLQSKPLTEIVGSWYYWSLPYFLTGAALIGVVTYEGSAHWEGLLVVAVLLGLLHFYSTLEKGTAKTDQPAQQINVRARVYYYAVLTAALVIAGGALLTANDLLTMKFAFFLLLTLVSSTWKVRLPGMEGTISVNFVMLLASIVELDPAQTVLVAAAGALVQCLWRPAKRPKFIPVSFSTATLMISASAVQFVLRNLRLSLPLLGTLLCGTILLYLANTLLVSMMFCLIEERSLGTVWHNCHFWTFNYYLVGAAAAGLMVSVGHSSGFLVGGLILPAMALVWVSFRLQTGRVMAPTV